MVPHSAPVQVLVRALWRPLLFGTLLLCVAGLYQLLQPPYAEGVLFRSRRWLTILAAGSGLALLLLGLLLSSFTSAFGRVTAWLERMLMAVRRLGKWNAVLFGLLVAGYSFLVLGPLGEYALPVYTRLLLYWLTVLAGWALLGGLPWKNASWAVRLGASLVLVAAGYRIAVYLLDISNHPFSAGWSETSRFYYASLFFAHQVYGQDLHPSVLHPSRYLMQSLPFLLPDSPLWLHRLWQVVLWLAVTLTSGGLLAWRLRLGQRWLVVLVTAWTFLFLLLGPVYYHLQIMLILVLAGFRPRSGGLGADWKSLAVLLLASAWAGISRVNWFPVPAMLAAALYFLEIPVGETPAIRTSNKNQLSWQVLSRWLRYLLAPLVWGIAGVLVAFGAQTAYASLSGNPAEQFTSSFTSDLLWYRLLPNPTYPLGILPAIILVALPLLLLGTGRLAGRWHSFHFLRLLGLGAMLLVLFVGGLVVSVKIGGGNNLHNMDAFLTLLLVVTAWIYFGRFQPEPGKPATSWAWRRLPEVAVLALALLVPLHSAVTLGGPLDVPTPQQTAKALDLLQTQIGKAMDGGGEVLFISERQLLTFHILQDVPLTPDYERVFLMEMAMAGNMTYLNTFHNELRDQRFAAIVSEPLFTNLKGAAEPFGEENDAWVRRVSRQILCYYEPDKVLRDVRVTILTPRPNPEPCD